METLVLVIFLIGTLIALVFALNAVLTLIRVRVPYVATQGWVVRWLVEHADLRPGQTFIEPGCGDARVLAALAGKHPETMFVGYELALWPYALARFRTRALKNVKIERRDFYRVSFAEADIIFCYLLIAPMQNLRKQFLELRPGATIYAYAFSIPYLTPVASYLKPGTTSGTRLWVYRVGGLRG